ncbi:MAG: caspase family protein [Thermodesulfovibrionales bacterium]
MKSTPPFVLFVLLVLPCSGMSAASSSDGAILIPLKDRKVVSTGTMEATSIKRIQESLANSVVFSPSGNIIASGGRGNTIVLHDTNTGNSIKKMEGRLKAVYSVAFSPDGSLLASGDHLSMVKLWDVSTGKEVKELKGHRSVVYSVAFSPDSKLLASGSKDRNVMLWDIRSGKLLNTFGGHSSVVYSVSFSPDGRTLASGSHDRSIILWDVSTGKKLKELKSGKSIYYSVAFSPDGRTLASGGHDSNVVLWDLQNGNVKKTLTGHRKAVKSVAFSPDGRTLASGSHDRTIMLWDVQSGKKLKTLTEHTSVVYSVAFHPGGGRLVSSGKDRNIIVWRLGGPVSAGVSGIGGYFQKGEFETTSEFKKRIGSKYLFYSSPAVLGKYNADRGIFDVEVEGKRVFVKVPRDVAREMKKRRSNLTVEGALKYHSSSQAELVNTYLVDKYSGERFRFGKHIRGIKIVSLDGQSGPKAVVKGAPKLSFSTIIEDENNNGVIDGGETVALMVKVKNSGKGSAQGVRVLLIATGEQTLIETIGRERSLGIIPPGGEEMAEFRGTMPNEFRAGNVNVKVSVKEVRGYSPMEVKRFTFAMRPADVKETSKVLSRLADVDIVPPRPRGHVCKDCYALVIGISKYRSIPEVKYAAKDAEIVSRYLENIGGVPAANIKLLKNDSATRADIVSSVEEWLPRRVKPSSKVYVYYAGHGTPDLKTNEAYIVPYEGEPGYKKKLYSLNQLYKSLGDLPSDNVFVMLDSCFSGAGGRSVMPKGSRPVSLSIENPVLAGEGVVVLAASRGDEISSDYERVKHGLFTYFLLKGLKGDADTGKDGMVDISELYLYVNDRVSETAVKELDREQHPVLLPGYEQVKGKRFNVTRVK